ncbi:hypothetical protein F183_A35000 [Bryobacterales bacterium F-183]|nr:hypothetical protein F183_A35000 [Bryobacterales bacterium F-183]
MRREDLELKRATARRQRDAANRELRTLRARTIPALHAIADALVEEYRVESRKRRDWVRDSTSLESYLEWQAVSAAQMARELTRDAVGDVVKLAQAELRMLVANDTVCALNRELTRLNRRRTPGWTNGIASD